jgi:hypothetical protein
MSGNTDISVSLDGRSACHGQYIPMRFACFHALRATVNGADAAPA